jgi:hypothetical protein
VSAFDSLFSNAAFETCFGAPVTYARGESEAEFTAMDSVMRVEAQLENQAQMIGDCREFVFKVSDLVLSESAVEPAAGDTITDAAGNVWEVRGIGQAAPWEFDADRNYFRARTVRISS